jgi:hypothetical protein
MLKRLLWLTAVLPVVASAASHPREMYRHVRPSETIKNIMNSIVNPNAEALWESVASCVTLKDVQENSPRNDADWTELRRKASKLMLASHLLAVPGRPVAKSGDQSRNPSIELSPETIEALITEDGRAWRRLVHGLQTSTTLVMNAIDKRNVKELRSANDALNVACEQCHQKYWYPNRSKLLQR